MNTYVQRAQRLLSSHGRRDKVSRKVKSFLARQRPRVRANRGLLEAELAAKKSRLESHPTTLILDPVTACNLNCPFCPTGGGYGTIKKEVLTPELFDRIVKNMLPELLEEVFLYNWGEPFLNKDIHEYIRFFASHGSYTEISTNFSMRDYESDFFEQLIESGLTELKVSLDGARQESYEKYRVGGNFERVVGNMKRLAAVKRARRKSYPHVTYRMLLNKHNQGDIADAARIAKDCDADFNPDPGFWCPDEERDEWLVDPEPEPILEPDRSPPVAGNGPEGAAFGDQPVETYCRQLWDTVVVNANGDVYSCCLIYKPEHAVGNLADQTIGEIRNAPKSVYLREFVVDPDVAPPEFDNHCDGCDDRHCVVKDPVFRQQPRR